MEKPAAGRPQGRPARALVPATPARRAALLVLTEAERRDAYAREVLDASPAAKFLEPRDVAFCRRLVLGTVATVGCLDDMLASALGGRSKVAKLQPGVRMALRIAAFELLYFDHAPEVAVSQGVELVRTESRAATGLANAALRRVAEDREAFLSAEDAVPDMRELVSAARRAGLPVWLVRSIRASIGEEAAAQLLASQLEPAPIGAFLNPKAGGIELDTELPGVLALVENSMIRALEPDGSLSDGWAVNFGSRLVLDMPALIESGVLDRGRLVISDAAAQNVVLMNCKDGTVLEVGSGRGTKSFLIQANRLKDKLGLRHVAVDLHEYKARLNLERLAAAGLDKGVEALAGDARDLDAVLAPLDAEAGERILFDYVLVDAPCSGTGTMRRHPEIPWRLTRREVERDLPELQTALLAEAATRVAPGGRLIYATCSVLAQENGDVARAFSRSEAGADFSMGMSVQTVPAPGAFDGHFHTVFERHA